MESILAGKPVNDMVKKTCDLLHLKVEDAVQLANNLKSHIDFKEGKIKLNHPSI